MPRTEPLEDTFHTTLMTEAGGRIRFAVVHGRLNVAQIDATGRRILTTPISTERARHLAQRLNELCAVAEAMGA